MNSININLIISIIVTILAMISVYLFGGYAVCVIVVGIFIAIMYLFLSNGCSLSDKNEF